MAQIKYERYYEVWADGRLRFQSLSRKSESGDDLGLIEAEFFARDLIKAGTRKPDIYECARPDVGAA